MRNKENSISEIRHTSDELSWGMEKRLIPDGVKCLLHRQITKHFPPLAGVAHVCQIEPAVRHVCKSRKAILKKRRQCVRTWTSEPGAKVQAILIPFRVDINSVVKSWILRWRLNVSWLKYGLDDFVGFSRDLLFYCLRNERSMTRGVNPLSWYFCHIQILLTLWKVTVFCALSLGINGCP